MPNPDGSWNYAKKFIGKQSPSDSELRQGLKLK